MEIRDVSFAQITADQRKHKPATTAAAQPNGGIFIPPDVTIAAFTEQTVAAVARHRLPALYSEREFVTKGGLVYYGTDRMQLYRGCCLLCGSHLTRGKA